MYTDFAGIYDLLMADVDYEAWAGLYRQLLTENGAAPGAQVCECACGTGSLTCLLAKAGYRMTGVDLSGEMLQLAGDKARRAGLSVPFIRQDMRLLRLHRPMDAVLATCDGVNYLLTEEALCEFLAAAREALKPGGCLAFDVSTPWKLEHELGNRLLCEDADGYTYIWQNRWHASARTVDLSLCVFVREKDGRYRRVEEEQRQRAWTRDELTAALERSGFSGIRVCGEQTLEEPAPKEKRWHLAAIRT